MKYFETLVCMIIQIRTVPLLVTPRYTYSCMIRDKIASRYTTVFAMKERATTANIKKSTNFFLRLDFVPASTLQIEKQMKSFKRKMCFAYQLLPHTRASVYLEICVRGWRSWLDL